MIASPLETTQEDMTYTAEQPDEGKRLDVFLSERLSLNRSLLQEMVKQGAVTINGVSRKKPSTRLHEQDRVDIQSPENIFHEEIGIDRQEEKKIVVQNVGVVAETQEYVVLNKPAGLLVHPTGAHEKETLLSWVLARYPMVADVGGNSERPGIVHRLDKEASGLLVIPKTRRMFNHLKKQFQQRTVEKQYIVLVHGQIQADHGMIRFPIDRSKKGYMVARPQMGEVSLANMKKIQPGKEALTEFWVEKRRVNYTLIDVRIHTGRTHQIRVHLFSYGHPVVGDTLYGNKKINNDRYHTLGRLFLHARKLCFADFNGMSHCYESPLPEELTTFLKGI